MAIDRIIKDSSSSVWNSSTLQYENLVVFCWFLCVSLNVLVSYSNKYSEQIPKIIRKAHKHLQTYTQKISKIQAKFHF
jgi:hypothetical protein